MLALAIPPLFLHARYNPGIDVPVGSTDIGIELSDIAVLAVALAALRSGLRDGWTPLRAGRVVWALALSFLTLVTLATLYGPAVTDGYPFASSAVSAATFVEYAALAPAVPLLLRRRGDLALVLGVLVAWAAAATAVGLLQFAGALGDLDHTPAGRRKPSFVGYHDFAALAGAALAVVVATLTLARGRVGDRFVAVGGAAGAVGVALAGALATLGATLAGTLAALTLGARRRTLTGRAAVAIVALVAVAATGSLVLRSGDLGRFFGSQREQDGDIQTYAHRTVLSYIGLRIFLDHPLVGTGWQGSGLRASYEPQLDDARKRFPDVATEAFPSPAHPWGVQNAYVQAAADLGVLGVVLLVALVVAGMSAAARRALRAPPAAAFAALVALLWITIAAFALSALGLVAGAPTDALLWLGLGLSVASDA